MLVQSRHHGSKTLCFEGKKMPQTLSSDYRWDVNQNFSFKSMRATGFWQIVSDRKGNTKGNFEFIKDF